MDNPQSALQQRCQTCLITALLHMLDGSCQICIHSQCHAQAKVAGQHNMDPKRSRGALDDSTVLLRQSSASLPFASSCQCLSDPSLPEVLRRVVRHPVKSVFTYGRPGSRQIATETRTPSGALTTDTRTPSGVCFLSAFVGADIPRHNSFGCECQVWSVQYDVVRTGCCRSEAVRMSFTQRSLFTVSKPIFPLLVPHSRCAEPTHVLLQFADQNLLVTRVCLKPDSILLPRQEPDLSTRSSHVIFVSSETTPSDCLTRKPFTKSSSCTSPAPRSVATVLTAKHGPASPVTNPVDSRSCFERKIFPCSRVRLDSSMRLVSHQFVQLMPGARTSGGSATYKFRSSKCVQVLLPSERLPP